MGAKQDFGGWATANIANTYGENSVEHQSDYAKEPNFTLGCVRSGKKTHSFRFVKQMNMLAC